MAVTEVSICNSALIKVGADRINSLSEQNKRARLCNTLYETMRDDVLAAYPWNFAIARAELSQVDDEPIFGFDYIYQLPSDVLRVLEVQEKDYVWKIEGAYLLSDEGEIQIKYIRREDDVTKFSMMFAEALAYRLAMELAYPLAQNRGLRDSLEKI